MKTQNCLSANYRKEEFLAVYSEIGGDLYGTALRLTRNVSSAEDLVFISFNLALMPGPGYIEFKLIVSLIPIEEKLKNKQ
jgi:hypothetical protein